MRMATRQSKMATRQFGEQPQLTLGVALTGKLYRGETDGAVRGWLFDHKTGLRIEFNGARDPRPQGGYLLMGKVVP